MNNFFVQQKQIFLRRRAEIIESRKREEVQRQLEEEEDLALDMAEMEEEDFPFMELQPEKFHLKNNQLVESSCRVCLDNRADYVLNRYRHLYYADSIKRLTGRNCPLCRQSFDYVELVNENVMDAVNALLQL